MLDALATLALETPPRVSTDAELRAALQARLETCERELGAPGLTAAVALADGRVLAFAAGSEDREGLRAMPVDARMLAGSVGKTFYAALALDLVAKGELDLDARIATLLAHEPWLERLPNHAAITVRMLMNHSSGLVRYELDPKFLEAFRADPKRSWTPREELEFVLDRTPPFEAGARFEYSDTNYVVLALVLERRTQSRCTDEIERRFLKPLALVDTQPSTSRELARLPSCWAGAKNPFGDMDAMVVDGRFAIDPSFEGAGGGYVTSSADLCRWARALWGGRALDAKVLAQAFDGIEAPLLGPTARYGLGVILRPTPHGPSAGHSGFFPGSLTEVRYYRDHDLAVAVQTNTSEVETLKRSLGSILDDLAGLALGR